MAQNYINKRPRLQFTNTKHMQGSNVEEAMAVSKQKKCLVHSLNGPAYNEQVIT